MLEVERLLVGQVEHADTQRVDRHVLGVELVVVDHIKHQISHSQFFFLGLRNFDLFSLFRLSTDLVPDLLFELADVQGGF